MEKENNNYKHLVEFKISETSELMDVKKLYIGRPIIVKTEEDTYNSYISAIKITDENYIYFKSGSLRNMLLDKLKASKNSIGDKLDKTGGIIQGNLSIEGNLKINQKEILTYQNHCRMSISGITTAHSTTEIIKHWGQPTSNGFIADTNNYRLEIQAGTEAVEITGQLCGYGNCFASILIKDTDGNYPSKYNWHQGGLLVQPQGNGYWKQCFTSGIVQLDRTKKYYVQLEAGGYNGQAFEINNGFGEYSSWIQAKEIN